MRVAIVGFPYSGKSTVFSAIANIPRANLNLTGENIAAVRIPEPRLDDLEKMYQPKKRTEATMEFIDLPGGAGDDGNANAGLAKNLPSLRQAAALVVVLRAFQSDSVPAFKDRVDPRADLSIIRDEITFADLLACTNRVEKLEAAVKKPTKDQEKQKKELELLKRCQEALEAGKPLRDVIQPGEEEKLVRSFGFLTQKPLVVAFNVGEADAAKPPPFIDPAAAATVTLCATLELDLAQLAPEERGPFLAEYGLKEIAGQRLVRAAFDALGMMFFLTAGPEEVRSWPITRGATAVDAAAEIHSDIARGFIRAETVAFADLLAAGNMRDAKAANKVRLEPKHYVVQDGDVILFKFNV
ncbi:MAG: DUF933 domain-containing protein [Phycisphaerae bacterium]|nr:DUF933 domain-containing protein [Phycisphaerae bacterium]